jgi:ferric-dicitrate binding protein FerR (iron transport regulator)
MPPSKRDLQEQRDQDAIAAEHAVEGPDHATAEAPARSRMRRWLAIIGLALAVCVLGAALVLWAARPDASTREYRMEGPR